jgi:hypothetical protein
MRGRVEAARSAYFSAKSRISMRRLQIWREASSADLLQSCNRSGNFAPRCVGFQVVRLSGIGGAVVRSVLIGLTVIIFVIFCGRCCSLCLKLKLSHLAHDRMDFLKP